MQIFIPGIAEQQRQVVTIANKKAIEILKNNQDAPVFDPQTEIDESKYSNAHTLDKSRYEAPHPDIVGAYFRHFQKYFPEYGTDKALAALLDVSSDRRIREFKSGARPVPYPVWDKFLVMTGRKPQDVISILGYLG